MNIFDKKFYSISGNNKLLFGRNRKKHCTANQIQIQKEIKRASIDYGWIDIYTNKKFTKENYPTIEHIIPFSQRKSLKVFILKKKGFELNGLDNIFPSGIIGNLKRSKESILTTIIKEPLILDRIFKEIKKYRKYNSELIDGKNWAYRLTNTLILELTGLASDIKSRKLIVFK